MSSALLLEKHFFSKLELKPNLDAKPEGSFSLACAVTIAKAADDPSRYQITLKSTISPDPKTAALPYYSGEIEVVGFFRIAQGYNEDPDRLASISGASVLFGAVRELFCNLTARGPWPMVTLPTMNFTPQPTGAASEEMGMPGKNELPAAVPAAQP